MLSKKKKIKEEAVPKQEIKSGVMPGKATGKTKGKDTRR